MTKRPGIIVPKSRTDLLADLPAVIKAQAVDLGHLGIDSTTLRVANVVVFNQPRNIGQIPAIILRILPEGHLISGDEFDDATGERIKVPWAGKLPLLNNKAFKVFVPPKDKRPPKEGWPAIDEIIAGPVPHLWDVQQQAKAHGYPPETALMVASYLIVKRLDAL